MLFLSILFGMIFRVMLPLPASTTATANTVAPVAASPSTLTSPQKTSTSSAPPVTKTHLITISGFTYEDLNNNGTYDSGEPHAPFMQLLAYDSAAPSTQLGTIFSDANGNFTVSLPVTKSLLLRQTAYNGFTPENASATTSTYPTNASNVQFGFVQLASIDEGQFGTISGEVYEDKNGNSTKDSGENGMQFSTISLTDGNGNFYITNQNTQATNADGSFRFEHLPLGKTYHLVLTDPTGTFFINKTEYDIPLSAAQKDVSGLELPVKRN
jgi:hypothetical protein